MVISKTPLRISFFGGGTDYPDHVIKHGGAYCQRRLINMFISR